MLRLRNIIIAIVIAGLFAGVLIIALKREDEAGSTNTEAIYINEFMASNKSTITDENGEFNDWIEIYNPTQEAVNLFSYGLSDDSADVKWTFPNIMLEPGAYIVVFATNKTTNDKNAPYQHIGFKLNADKGAIFLTNSTGQTVDGIEYKDQVSGVSFGRNEALEWVSGEPTPGFSNDAAGAAAFLQSRKTDEDYIIITEVMSQNRTTIADSSGEFHDYIEIYNEGSEAVSLLGYSMSDDPKNITKWRFPDVMIGAGEYMLVFASGYETSLPGDDMYANFRISSLEEQIVISNRMGLEVDSVYLREVKTDNSYERVLSEDGSYSDEWRKTDMPTPRHSNNSEGFSAFMQTNVIASGQIIINEVMVSNGSVLAEGDGEFYDWIELYNRGDAAINLNGFSLSDDQNNPSKWKFDDTTLGAGEYIVVMASGEIIAADEEVKKNYIHTNFRLSASGEVVALYDSSGTLQDRYSIRYTPRDISIGRVEGENELFYFEEPTPNGSNVSPSAGVVSVPRPSKPGGSYEQALQIEIDSATDGAKIYYTLDGSEPTQNSALYAAPIEMQSTGVIRAKAYEPGYIDSEMRAFTYFIGETHDLPLLSVVIEPDYLFDEQTGIYELGPDAKEYENSPGHYYDANYTQSGQESERAASFEVFDESGSLVFVQNVSIRIQGGFSRDKAQKSFAIFARSEYGPGSMEYAFFDDRPFTEYQAIQLRQGGQDQNISKIREVVALSLVEGKFNFITQAVKPYVLYINGEYWGVYFMQEKRNEEFIAAHEGVDDPDNMNILKATSIALQGSNVEYKDLLKFIESNDMSQKDNYDYIAQYVDTDSFMDVMINEIYIANSDYANMQFYQILPDGKWKQIYYDFCWTFALDHPTLERRMDMRTTSSTLFNGLLDYKPWRDAFIKKFAWALKEIYNPERVLAAIDHYADIIRDEIPAERAKFGGTVGNWDANVEKMREFARERGKVVVRHLKETFSLSAEQIEMLEDAIS